MIKKTAYLGHIMRNRKYQLMQVIIEGKIEERKGMRRKKKYFVYIIGKTYP